MRKNRKREKIERKTKKKERKNREKKRMKKRRTKEREEREGTLNCQVSLFGATYISGDSWGASWSFFGRSKSKFFKALV